MSTEPSKFMVAFAGLQRARADLATLTLNLDSSKESDNKVSEALNALTNAEWNLVRTPADGLAEIRQRALVVQEMFDMAHYDGEPTDNRHRLMLSVLIGEILSPLPVASAA